MKLLAHLLSADVRRFRLIAAALIVTTIAGATLDLAGPAVAGNDKQLAAIETSRSLIWLSNLLLFLAAAPLLIQTHALVGSDTFWMTRPIPWRSLLASKLVLLTIMIFVPAVVCEIVLMIVYDVTTLDIVYACIQLALWHALWMMAAVTAASLTRTLAGFAFLCGGTLLLVAVTVAVSAVMFIRDLAPEAERSRLASIR
jgi:hypothetical protein